MNRFLLETDGETASRAYDFGVRTVTRSDVLDGLVALVCVTLTAVATWVPSNDVGEDGVAGATWVKVLYLVGLGVPMLWRRRAPLAALAAMLAAMILQAVVTQDSPEGLELIFAWCVIAYSVAAWSSRREALWGLAALLAGYGIYAAENHDIRGGHADSLWAGGFFAVMIVAMWLVGAFVSYRRNEVRVQAAAEAAMTQAREAVDRERARLAREMHDVVAHNLSVVVVQAAGARAAGKGDETTLAKIEQSGRESLVEMRRLLGVLRQDEGAETPWEPRPGIADLPALADRVGGAGVPVTLDVEGDATGVAPLLDLCVYRIVQESLTNVLKHAPGATARVHLVCGAETIVVDVEDDGPDAAEPGPGGHGLIGMRERVKLFDGELVAGRRAGGGFGVHATLPREDVASLRETRS